MTKNQGSLTPEFVLISYFILLPTRASPVVLAVTHLPMHDTEEMWVRSLGWEDLLEEEMVVFKHGDDSAIP